jgi:hypothetical protein
MYLDATRAERSRSVPSLILMSTSPDVAVDEVRRKTFHSGIDFEADSRFGRREGLAQTRLRIYLTQIVEHGLAGSPDRRI